MAVCCLGGWRLSSEQRVQESFCRWQTLSAIHLLLAAEQPLKLLCCSLPSHSAAILLYAGCEGSARHPCAGKWQHQAPSGQMLPALVDLQHLSLAQKGKKPVHALESLEAACRPG